LGADKNDLTETITSPPFESKSLVSLVNLPQVRREPDLKVNKGPGLEKRGMGL